MGKPAPSSSGGFALNSSNPWPQFRGARRDNRSTETGLLKQWSSNGPKLLWKANGLGKGYSSVAVSGGLVITMGDSSDGSLVHAVEEATGNRVWTSSRVGGKGGNYDGTKSTPAIDLANRRLYALGQFGDLVCLNLENGEEIWRQSLTGDLGGKFSQWNYAESPLLDGNRVIVTPGGRQGTVAALNAANGSTVWRSRQFTDEAQYVSVIPSPLPGRKHYIQLTAQTLVGLDVENGNLVWRIPRRGQTAVIPTPVVYNNIVFVTSGYKVGSHAFQINSAGGRLTTRRLYETKDLINHHGGIVLVDKYVYGHSDRGGWKCIDITNGSEMWGDRGVGKGAITYADGHLITRSETGNGSVALIEASPSGYREKGRFDPPDRTRRNSWAHPVVANGKLFLRDQDVLLCYDLKE
ncbi:MAG: PQQ-binding-like beta-propeller repeat protein [Limisphaerales bacterium]